MTKPIVLYDENHERVGETYPRRAKQLVRSGRAFWLEDGQGLCINTKLESYPPHKEDVCNMEEPIYQNNGLPFASTETTQPGESNDLLLYLAKRNVVQKLNLIKHIVVYAIIWFAIIAICSVSFFHDNTAGTTELTELLGLSEFGHGGIRMSGHPRVFRVREGSISWAPLYDTTGHIINFNDVFATESLWHTVDATSSPTPWWWFFSLGVMTAWGVWIVMRGIVVSRQYFQNRIPKTPKPPKPDPIVLEYQRLKQRLES